MDTPTWYVHLCPRVQAVVRHDVVEPLYGGHATAVPYGNRLQAVAALYGVPPHKVRQRGGLWDQTRNGTVVAALCISIGALGLRNARSRQRVHKN